MENRGEGLSPSEAAAAIAAAEAGRASLAHQVVVPRLFFVSLGAAVAVQIGTTALGLAGAGWSPLLVLVAGIVVFVVVSLAQLARFRRMNGVWLGGLLSRVIGGTATAASVSYGCALAGATWAAFEGVWWLVPFTGIAGGAAYALSGVGWVRKYRSDPATHSRGESTAWLAIATTLAMAFLILLVAQR